MDESLFEGWNPDYNRKIVEVEFDYFQLAFGDAPAEIIVYLDWMDDGSYPDPGSPGYVQQEMRQVVTPQGGQSGWQHFTKDVTLDHQPRYLSLEFYFGGVWTGTHVNVIDNVDLQGQCIPEPGGLFALGTGLIGLVGVLRRRR